MNNLALFIVGFFISLIVIGVVGLLFYAAVLDGRYEREQEANRLPDNS